VIVLARKPVRVEADGGSFGMFLPEISGFYSRAEHDVLTPYIDSCST
jgi:hypothetical protein